MSTAQQTTAQSVIGDCKRIGRESAGSGELAALRAEIGALRAELTDYCASWDCSQGTHVVVTDRGVYETSTAKWCEHCQAGIE